MENIAKKLNESAPELLIKKNESLAKYTYTKTGGNADLFVMPKTTEEVQSVVQFCSEESVPLTILGNGSNLIVKDGGIRGIVLYLDLLNTVYREDTMIYAGSGAKLIDVSRFARDESLTGLEFACGIPGSVGGALYMNAGAYGGEISDCLHKATVLTTKGELLHLERADLAAKYRHSTVAEKKLYCSRSSVSIRAFRKTTHRSKDGRTDRSTRIETTA
ncbi:UDP-N-acetylenolpyruvoylglucosamine reductase [Listeria fleischmannii FSL S10-1203]|uniref:UDP-N-acetylenolpyruvoylglucosamine reductase n=1 Tax=Listeria fleischmannii FSL S10-1203 TaxID=1265822 RepID=W7DNP6_9LIST|nr:UDP-N-acetylenolpyruvoylglucosamine reductase [Listeria fleischmannii FSL S10-1203]